MSETEAKYKYTLFNSFFTCAVILCVRSCRVLQQFISKVVEQD